jgi:hypothetical protein
MRLPKRTQAAWHLIEALYMHGPLTFEEGIRSHRLLGRSRSTTKVVYERSIKNGWIHLMGGKYCLTPMLAMWLENELGSISTPELSVAGPRYRPPFKVLSYEKYLPLRYSQITHAK